MRHAAKHDREGEATEADDGENGRGVGAGEEYAAIVRKARASELERDDVERGELRPGRRDGEAKLGVFRVEDGDDNKVHE